MREKEVKGIKYEAKKSYVWLQTVDGSIQQVEEDIAKFCLMIYREMRKGAGSSKNNPIILPQQVSPDILSSILDYCRYHQVPGHSDKERKSFNDKFIKLYVHRLYDLTAASHSLELRPLIDLTSTAISRIVDGRNNKEIREILRLPEDLPEVIVEKKFEPVENPTNDPHIRCWNHHLARKRKCLKERKEVKNAEKVEKEEDQRPVDELVALINADDKDNTKNVISPKNKKRNRRKKNNLKYSSEDVRSKMSEKESANPSELNLESGTIILANSTNPTENHFSTSPDFDSDLDIEKMKENDRIVAEFARRLSSNRLCLGSVR